MTEPNVSRVKPRNPGVRLEDLVWLVRVPHAPALTMAFTAGEEELARQHAGQHGGILVLLPVPDPVWDWTGPHRQSLGAALPQCCCVAAAVGDFVDGFTCPYAWGVDVAEAMVCGGGAGTE